MDAYSQSHYLRPSHSYFNNIYFHMRDWVSAWSMMSTTHQRRPPRLNRQRWCHDVNDTLATTAAQWIEMVQAVRYCIKRPAEYVNTRYVAKSPTKHFAPYARYAAKMLRWLTSRMWFFDAESRGCTQSLAQGAFTLTSEWCLKRVSIASHTFLTITNQNKFGTSPNQNCSVLENIWKHMGVSSILRC